MFRPTLGHHQLLLLKLSHYTITICSVLKGNKVRRSIKQINKYAHRKEQIIIVQ
jgi:hypothetical protein